MTALRQLEWGLLVGERRIVRERVAGVVTEFDDVDPLSTGAWRRYLAELDAEYQRRLGVAGESDVDAGVSSSRTWR